MKCIRGRQKWLTPVFECWCSSVVLRCSGVLYTSEGSLNTMYEKTQESNKTMHVHDSNITIQQRQNISRVGVRIIFDSDVTCVLVRSGDVR